MPACVFCVWFVRVSSNECVRRAVEHDLRRGSPPFCFRVLARDRRHNVHTLPCVFSSIFIEIHRVRDGLRARVCVYVCLHVIIIMISHASPTIRIRNARESMRAHDDITRYA